MSRGPGPTRVTGGPGGDRTPMTENEMPDRGSQGGAGTRAGWVRDLSRARSEVGKENEVQNRKNLSRAHV